MLAKENKKRYIQFIKEYNASKGDINKIRYILEAYCAPGCIIHHARMGDMNLDQAAQYYAEIWAAFPDLFFSIDDMVAEEDKMAVRCAGQGTHTETFMEIPATGKRIVMEEWQMFKIEKGKAVEAWELPDGLGMMVQLGVAPDTLSVK